MNKKKDINDIWKEYFKTKKTETKNILVMEYIDLVRKVVYRMMPTYEGYSNFDDMVSSGVIGLMDAIEKFDQNKQVKFEYYASMRIKGEIIDQIRKQDWAPSSLRRRIKAVTNAYTELEAKLFRTPLEDEVAKHLGIEVQEVNDIMLKSHTFNIMHFEEVVSQNSMFVNNIPSEDVSTEQLIEKNETLKMLGDVIDNLPEREKLVITLYYYEELTLKEISSVIGVTESRVSQIHSKVLLKLRENIKSITQN